MEMPLAHAEVAVAAIGKLRAYAEIAMAPMAHAEAVMAAMAHAEAVMETAPRAQSAMVVSTTNKRSMTMAMETAPRAQSAIVVSTNKRSMTTPSWPGRQVHGHKQAGS